MLDHANNFGPCDLVCLLHPMIQANPRPGKVEESRFGKASSTAAQLGIESKNGRRKLSMLKKWCRHGAKGRKMEEFRFRKVTGGYCLTGMGGDVRCCQVEAESDVRRRSSAIALGP